VSTRTLQSLRNGVLAFALALLTAAALAVPVKADSSDYGIESVGASLSTNQAGAHPDFSTSFKLKTDPQSGISFAGTEDASVAIPPGLVGNATEFPTCPVAQFVVSNALPAGPPCPYDSQIGVARININVGFPGANFDLLEPIYNLPGSEKSPARLGFLSVYFPVIIDFKLRSDGDYGLTAVGRSATDFFPVNSVEITTWGVPSDPSHDGLRMNPAEAANCQFACEADNGSSRPSGLGPVPFMTNPTSCGPKQVDFAITSYALPGKVFTDTASLGDIIGCEQLPFEPSISLTPTTQAAEAPAGLDVSLKIPQDGLEHANTLGSAHLKKSVVRLPKGMAINPSAADGLAGCSQAQVGVTSKSPLHFNLDDVTCPESSKVGTVEIATPLLPDPIDGSLYLARQSDNPFDSLLSGYLIAKGQGLLIKLAGRFDLDPSTGQVTATFDNNPQQPFSELQLHFQSGSRAPLVTPTSCGTYVSEAEFVSWGGQVKNTTSAFEITKGPNGGPCPNGEFDPKLTAGTTNPVAGGSSPFVFRLTREDGEENIAGIETTLPKGVLAKLAGVSLCADALAGSGDCPASSQVGTVTVGAGSGSTPVFLPQPGKTPTAVYLAGPYKGGPYSLVAKVPAQAGPFDLGTVTVRNALHVDPVTTQVTVKSDPLPQILKGIPVSYREIGLNVDRAEFTINPTSCEPMQVTSTITSVGGKVAHPASRFQAGDCASLGFQPKLKMSFSGATHRSAHPKLRAVLTARKGDANIRKATVTLPKTEFLENAHIRTVCTRVQYAAQSCPKAAVYGYAKAWSPLLDKPLAGPVYLRSSDNELPDLVASLDGQIHVDLAGRIDSVNSRIRTTFPVVPDAPVSRFELTMQGGKKGLLVNNTELCRAKPIASVQFQGQNGRASRSSPAVKISCGKK
jgi:hypothetical protein